MAAPDIASITKYTGRGKGACYWVADIADPSAPTREELDAGTNLASILTDAGGWDVSTDQIQVKTYKSRITTQIAGEVTFGDAQITLLMDEEGDDGRDLMPADEAGHVVWFYGGDVAGRKMNVFKVTVASQSEQPSYDGSDADTMMFSYAIDAAYRNLEVPAA